MSVIDLQEISPNNWRAKYQGNYGIYTIKVVTAGEKTTSFSCSCPSDGYPCKHIPMVEEAIEERIAETEKSNANKSVSVDELLKDVSQKELYDFIVRQAKYNTDLTNSILLEFSHKVSHKDATGYSSIVCNALKKLHFDYDNYYEYEDGVDIDVLDQWLKKAQQYLEQKNYHEAVLIAKACLEEFAAWLQDADEYIIDYLDSTYQERPFEILGKAAAGLAIADSKALFDYCKSELAKTKYAETDMYDGFNDLLMELSATTNPDEFLALQDNLLAEIEDKSSYDAEKILQRKIAFYRSNNQPEKAWDIIAKNIQIESFRKELVKKNIEERNFAEAKKLIRDFMSNHTSDNFYRSYWNELRLNIAQKEKDIPVIREVSFSFIQGHFDEKNYRIYKSTFSAEERANELEKLIKHYQQTSRGFSASVADVLAEEKAAERLMKYVENHLSVEIMERYYIHFATLFPEKTLALFRQPIDQYAEANIGRNHYECIAKLLKKMTAIKGGDKVVEDMVNQYKIRYKNRKAMMEILNYL